VDQLSRALGFQAAEDDTPRLQKLNAILDRLAISVDGVLSPLAALLGIVTRDGTRRVPADPAQLRRETLDALMQVITVVAEGRPLLFVVEDAHWMDPSTQELIGHLIDAIQVRRLMIVLTARPEYHPPWVGLAHFSTLSLSRLSRRETDAMIRHVAKGDLSPDVLSQLVSKTDGIPLFIGACQPEHVRPLQHRRRG
jgi:predicted ATPase